MTYTYITLPNSVVSANLSKTDTAVLVYLYMIAQRYGTATITGYEVKCKQSTLAQFAGVSERQVRRCVDKLIGAGFLFGKTRTVRQDRSLSTYIYALPLIPNKSFFSVSLKALRLVMSDAPSALREYLYCCKCATTQRSFYHSYRDVSEALGISRSDAIARLNVLAQLKVISKCKKISRCGSHTENTYIVIVFIKGEIKRKSRHVYHSASDLSKNSTTILSQVIVFVKGFVKKCGVLLKAKRTSDELSIFLEGVVIKMSGHKEKPTSYNLTEERTFRF